MLLIDGGLFDNIPIKPLENRGYDIYAIDLFAKSNEHKTKIFNPEIPKDSELLNTLLNSTNHKIQYWKDTWTALGEYRVFVVYYEIKKEET